MRYRMLTATAGLVSSHWASSSKVPAQRKAFSPSTATQRIRANGGIRLGAAVRPYRPERRLPTHSRHSKSVKPDAGYLSGSACAQRRHVHKGRIQSHCKTSPEDQSLPVSSGGRHSESPGSCPSFSLADVISPRWWTWATLAPNMSFPASTAFTRARLSFGPLRTRGPMLTRGLKR